nr:MAG TPA: hypothetical protein [Caudoviricetes sp.]
MRWFLCCGIKRHKPLYPDVPIMVHQGYMTFFIYVYTYRCLYIALNERLRRYLYFPVYKYDFIKISRL